MNRTTVLCVDDDPHVLQALTRVLGKRYRVVCADTAAHALSILREQSVQIVLTDQQMPEMTGLDLLRQVRQIAPQIVRLLLTGYADLNAVVGSINEGEVFRLLNKPWSNEALLATIARAEALAINLSQEPPGELRSRDETPMALLRCVVHPGTQVLAESAVAQRYLCYRASTPDEVLSQLEAQPKIGVLLVEFSPQAEIDEVWISFLGRLKRDRPTLVALVISAVLDFNSLARLINQAQVFRYLTLPCSEDRLQSALASAAEQHLWLHQHPDSCYVSDDSRELSVVTHPVLGQDAAAPGRSFWGGLWRRLRRGQSN